MTTIDEIYADITFAQAYKTWETSARRIMTFTESEREETAEEFEKAVWDTHAMLRKLAAHVIEAARVRDELVQPIHIAIEAMEQREFIDSKKMDLRFEVCASGYETWL